MEVLSRKSKNTILCTMSLEVPTQSTAQVARFLEYLRHIKQRLADNDIHLGGYRIETLVEHRTVEGAVNFYLERQVFKVNKYIQPACLVIHRMLVLQYLESLDAIYDDRAIAHLTRMGVMHWK